VRISAGTSRSSRLMRATLPRRAARPRVQDAGARARVRSVEEKREPVRQVRHVITRGDTLSEIAERYNVSTAAIRSANKLANDKIRVGQTLSIPIYAGS